MGDVFLDSGWRFDGTDQLDAGIDLGPASATASHGILHLISDFNKNVAFNFNAGGAGLGISASPLDISGAVKEMPAVGAVLVNPAFRSVLSVDDFSGACLIQSYTGATPFPGIAGAVSVMFFDVDKGIIASLAATILSGGVLALGAHATIIASCSAMLACASVVGSTPQVGASVMLGYFRLKDGKRGAADLCAYPWKVTIDGTDYSYVFHEDGRCYWYNYDTVQLSANGKGKWRVVKDFVEISWNSGGTEIWNLPISHTAQIGSGKNYYDTKAKIDLTKMPLVPKTR